jgi:hypothetical protein
MSNANASDQLTTEAAERLSKEAAERLSTPQGREIMDNALRRGAEMVRRLREARQIPPERLRETIGI